MLDIFKSKATKELEEKKAKEVKRQAKYKRVNVVFKEDEYEKVKDFLNGKSLSEYVKEKLKEDELNI